MNSEAKAQLLIFKRNLNVDVDAGAVVQTERTARGEAD